MKPIFGLAILYLIIHLGLIAFAIVIGFLLHWMFRSVDLGTGILIGAVTAGLSIHFMTRVLKVINTVMDNRDEDEDGEGRPWEGYPYPAYPPRRRRRRREE